MTKYCQNFSPAKPSYSGCKKFFKSMFWLGAAVLFIGVIVVYLAEINYISAKGFYTRDLERQIAAAKDENEKLEFRAVEMKSMLDLSEKVKNLNMMAVDNITYFDSAGQVVARR